MISSKTNVDALYDPVAAGSYLGGTKPIAKQTLAKWRCLGQGPVFIKIGETAVRYRRVDLDNWMAARLRNPAGKAAK